jgi:hypothetical protein
MGTDCNSQHLQESVTVDVLVQEQRFTVLARQRYTQGRRTLHIIVPLYIVWVSVCSAQSLSPHIVPYNP